MMDSNKENKGKLRIAILGHKTVPSREGGVEVVVTELSERMAARGHSVTCYNRRGCVAADNNSQEYRGVKLKSVVTFKKRGLAAASSAFFASVLAAFGKYDVVHFHAEGPCASMWITKLLGKRCITTVHGLDHRRAKWGKFASWYIRQGEKNAVRFADEIIVLSEGVQNYFIEKYNRRTLLIPNGVTRPEAADAKEITEKYGLNEDEYILYMGRLVPEKGLIYLIEAFKRIETDKKLIIAGGCTDSTEFAEELKSIAGDDPRIIFTGFVEGQVFKELYSNAYVYVLPSDLEGMPLSLLEAMSYGNCCLTSDIPECADVVGDFGITFRNGSSKDLQEKLQILCEEPDMVDYFKSRSADYICNKMNWDDVTDQTLKVYYADEEFTVQKNGSMQK